MNVDYKALYFSLSRQNGDLSTMIERYQHEIIPQYERLLEMARAERDANAKAITELATENAALLKTLRESVACDACKHVHTDPPPNCPANCLCKNCKLTCVCAGCKNQSKWEWEGLQVMEK